MANQAGASLRQPFEDPPREYGPVPLWWWDGGPLEPDRMTDQLESLAEQGVPSVCFISKYPHGPAGDDHRYFSEEWWDRMEHVARECDRLDMTLWVHDETYHHSPPTWREYWQDHIRTEATERPDLRGEVLHREHMDVEDGEPARLTFPASFTPRSIAAYPRNADGSLRTDESVALEPEGAILEWCPPDENEWHVAAVGSRPEGLCYTCREAAERYIDLHFEEYVRRLGELVGDVLVGTFEDELVILDGTVPCDDRVLERVRNEKGYDIESELIGLFEPTAATTNIRTDFYDVLTTIIEECWFEPLYEWHEEHDLLRSHDNWGRNDIAAGAEQYGDYYRTMRWYQVPGYDDGGPAAIGNRNFFDAKLAASIAACYDRDRVWGELFHSTGWGFAPKDQLAGIVENYCYGCNLYDKHGLYYTTLGGWWEHAPGDVHFRQPYWSDVEELNEAATRLGFLLSQGNPVVDVALAFPSASLHADWHPVDGIGAPGRRVDQATREIAESLYKTGTDLVIADPESLENGSIGDGKLAISGMQIPVLVLPPMTTMDRSTLAAARELYDAGGVVIAVGRLPDDVVDLDTDLVDTLEPIFGDDAVPGAEIDATAIVESSGSGIGILAPIDADLSGLLDGVIDRDVRAGSGIYHAHRRIGDHDVYLLFNVRDSSRTVEVSLRTDGHPERWDAITGEIESIYEYNIDDGIELTLDMPPHGFDVVVVGPGDGPRVSESSCSRIDAIEKRGDAVTVRGTTHSEHPAAAIPGDQVPVVGETTASVPSPIDLSDGWTFELEPTLDNQWGDFRYPPSEELIGVEVRSFRYRQERATDDGRNHGWHRPDVREDGWEDTEVTYGPRCWRRVTTEVVPSTPEESTDGWEPYEFSTTVGKPGTHPYLIGYTSVVSDHVLVSPEAEDAQDKTYFWTTVHAPESGLAAIQYGAGITRIELGNRSIDVGNGAGLGGVIGDSEALGGGRSIVQLPEGNTAITLAVEAGIETHFSVEPVTADARDLDLSYVPRVRWFQDPTYRFDYRPWDERPVGWFRFELPTGTKRFTLPVRGAPDVWVDGEARSVINDAVTLDTPLSTPTTAAIRVAHEPGAYAGAAWTDPVSIETEPVRVDAGRWEELGLQSYSGRGRYRRSVSLPEFDADGRVVLDLGSVGVTANVRVNDQPVGSTFSPPFEVDITEVAKPGENELEVSVANTLANHFATETPRRYIRSGPLGGEAADLLPNAGRDETVSGLIGPVSLRIEPRVEIEVEIS